MKKVTKASANIDQDSLTQLRRVFPQFIKDNQIDFDALKAFFDENGQTAGEEKYGLNWAGKSRAIQAARIPSTGTLAPRPKDSLNWDKTENLFIEGDNLEVLKLLQKHYREKIKMIYIDPPYNTGKDFIYKDNFKENIADYYERTGQTKIGIKLATNTESGGRYHSDWLTMMYPRLFLAKNLLRDDGVIFISIDDNEVHNLRHLMDEIFGQENFLACISRKTKLTSNKGNQFSPSHEYILSYARNQIELNEFNDKEAQRSKEYIKLFRHKDRRGQYNEVSLYMPALKGDRPSRYFIKCPDGSVVIPPGDRFWRWSEETFNKNLLEDRVVFKETKTSPLKDKNGKQSKWNIYTKLYFNERLISGLRPSTDITKWPNSLASKEMIKMAILFEYSKPRQLISYLCEISGTTETDLILDFFAGSGTTAHAVMDLNAQDGGKRKWILVQLPEITDEKSEAKKAGFNTISEICRERIKRAGKKIGKVDVGFKSYSLQKSNYRQWHTLDEKADEKKLKQQMKLVLDHPLVDGYDEAAVVYEVLLKEGFSLNSQVKKEKRVGLEVWAINDEDKIMLVTFAKKLTRDQIEKLGLKPEDTLVCLDSALDDTTKVNIVRNFNVKVI